MPLVPEEHLSEVREELVKARRLGHRRLLVVMSDDDSRLVSATLDFLLEVRDLIAGDNLLYTYHAFYSDGAMRKEIFARGAPKNVEVDYVSYHELDKILGRTYGACVADLVNNLEPNDLGRIMGVVRGGGLYILMVPSLRRLPEVVTRFQLNLVTPGYTVKDVRKLFERRFVEKLMVHDGIAVYDADTRVFLRKFPPSRAPPYERKPLVLPEKSKIPPRIYKLALTQDQVEVLRMLERFYEKVEGRKLVFVLTADRGRGKSSALGIGVGWLAHRLRRAKGRCRIVLTAPSPLNVQEVFRFSRKVLEIYKHPVEAEGSEEGVVALRSKGIDIEYLPPVEAARTRADVLVVDEAASISVPLLFKMVERYEKAVFSSTIHGYEGAGRGFSVRFLRRLRSERGVEVLEYEMSEPIRYAPNDPVETWIFDTLLLDAEPASLSEEDLRCVERLDVEYYKPDEDFFLRREDELRQFFGIYILSHYRNNPNDLGMIMNAPHHLARMLKTRTGKVVVSIELAVEGGLDPDTARECAKGAWIMGNIIPDRLIKHYKVLEFGGLRGFRIVRIATHPAVMRRGLGSLALKMVEEEARELGLDWVGAGFGVTEELLRFWVRNGFVPVHMSPEKNPVSGEYSVLVVKPLTERARKFVELFAREFREKLLGSLATPYFDLEGGTALELLESLPKDDTKLSLRLLQKARFLMYAWSDMTAENCMDVIIELAKHYFRSSVRPELTRLQKLLLIAKVLQAKSWHMACEELGLSPQEATAELRNVAKLLSAAYLGVKSEEEASRYFFLSLEDVTREQGFGQA
uniref:tRNA(Met) cytidine acetyltransferase TmcA n=2 Tax=Thermofilum pendens TaxID=2269 RepID=A0A7J3X4V0_THEPE